MIQQKQKSSDKEMFLALTPQYLYDIYVFNKYTVFIYFYALQKLKPFTFINT